MSARADSRRAPKRGGPSRASSPYRARALGPDNPIVGLTLVAAIFGYATFDVVTAGIDPSQQSFAMFLAFLGTAAGIWWSAIRRLGRDDMRDRAFLWGAIAGSVGLAIYAGFMLAALV